MTFPIVIRIRWTGGQVGSPTNPAPYAQLINTSRLRKTPSLSVRTEPNHLKQSLESLP